MSIDCPVCGTTNADGAEYCEGCGVALTSLVRPDASLATADAAPMQANAEHSGGEAEEASSGVVGHPLGADETLGAEGAGTRPVPPSAPVPVSSGASVSMPTAGAHLVHKNLGALTTTTIPLAGVKLAVGRFDPSSGPVEIDLSGFAGHENISRRHAEIYQDQGVWHVRDLGSTNGVFVKPAGADRFEPRLQAPAVLNDGDEIAFGNVTFVFRAGP